LRGVARSVLSTRPLCVIESVMTDVYTPVIRNSPSLINI
jgi:hypothetical protein